MSKQCKENHYMFYNIFLFKMALKLCLLSTYGHLFLLEFFS